MSDVAVLWWSAGLGVLSSLVASVVFLLALSCIRPRIDLSPHICRTTETDGTSAYYVKLVNRTWRPIANVKFLMVFATSRNVPGGPVSGGPIYMHDRIELRTREVTGIPKLDEKDNDHRYAVILRILTDLDDAWQNEEVVHIRFQVYATHSVTGFGKIFERKYYGKDATIKPGMFQRGRSFNIV